MVLTENYDAVVIGAGHAGCEAALALARLGNETLLLTLSTESIAMLACNPAIGGTAKGHLVREIDALGGEMGRAIDDTFIQSRMLNTGKGPAVHSLRAQADKLKYQQRMREALENQPRLTLRQGEAVGIDAENGVVTAVRSSTGAIYGCKACIVATGVYLKSSVIIGESRFEQGPGGLCRAVGLSGALTGLGFELRRFKTGTPARVDIRSIDLTKLEPQYGDEWIIPFSFLSDDIQKKQSLCYLGYTNERTHSIIRENLHRSPLFTGIIEGVGPRYCPSIEDKVVRFADKERHQFFLEPESELTCQWYVQGMSSSLPEDVQIRFYSSLPGFERVKIVKLAYAIEYDCIDSAELWPSLESKRISGLFMAGQINGSSGYEEAAAQGLMAGINAALLIAGREPVVLKRSDAYIGVLIDDLTTKSTNEPYRMMTSRAEYRLSLRQDNADIRLTAIGREIGLASEERMRRLDEKLRGIGTGMSALLTVRTPERANGQDLIKRGLSYDDVNEMCGQLPDISAHSKEQIEINLRYEGYLKRQEAQIREFKRLEGMTIPRATDFWAMSGLRIEAQEKLSRIRPQTLGQAARISGVSPGDISVLMIYIEKGRRVI